MKKIIDEIITDFDKIVTEFKEDQEVENENYLINYQNLVTENIRSNNKKISRNSFLMVLCVALYLLLFFEESIFESINLIFGSIADQTVLFYFLPVVFSFLYLQNITLWNNNINLIPLFEKLSRKMFKLGQITDTVNVIKPFSFFHHLLNYQYENKKINFFFKWPSLVLFVAILFGPILFNLFSVVYMLIRNHYSAVSIICLVAVVLLSTVSVVQAFNSHKK